MVSRRTVLTLEQRPNFCNVNLGWGAKAAPPVSPERIEICNAVFTDCPSTFLVVPYVSYKPSPHKFKMAAYRPDVPMISRYEWDICELPGKPPFLKNRNKVGLVRTLSYVMMSNISKMAAITGSGYGKMYISTCIYMIAAKLLKIYLCVRCQKHDWTDLNTAVGWVINQRWRPVSGSGYDIAYISACMRNSNVISTAIPMCSVSTTRLVWSK